MPKTPKDCYLAIEEATRQIVMLEEQARKITHDINGQLTVIRVSAERLYEFAKAREAGDAENMG